MFWLVESEEQLEKFYHSGYKEAFVEVIPYNNRIHPTKNEICAVYIRPLLATKGFIIPICHGETLTVDIDNVKHVLDRYNKLYVRDKKEFLHYFPLKTLYDITLNSHTYIQQWTQTHSYFYSKMEEKKDINKVTRVYNDMSKYESHFHAINDEFTYTQYNFKTLTGRPSNKFKGVNYAALNKDNGSRKSFIPSNGTFIEFDIGAYHPTLLSKLVDYDFGGKDIHMAFAEMYGVDYKKAKELTFKQLYGGVFDQYKDLEFFKKVQVYTDELWARFQNEGYIECPISKYIFFRDELEDMKPQKLLNYLLQNLETSYNVCILWELLKLLKNTQTKLVLYTYDSFLFDFSENDTGLLDKIKDIFKQHKLQIKTNYGNTYDFK